MSSSYWERSYQSGHVPWDPGPYDRHVPRVVEEYGIAPCPTLDVGCGTGGTLIWLARRGFEVTGIDLAPTAVEIARRNAKSAGVSAKFVAGDFPDSFSPAELQDGSFGFVIERGLLHMLTSPREHNPVLRRIHQLLSPDGLFYSLMAKREGASRFGGPPVWSQNDIVRLYTPYFTIEELRADVFTPGEPGSIPAWVCVMRGK